jgi:uncharacterized membrane protein YkvA (DUF1232 family)
MNGGARQGVLPWLRNWARSIKGDLLALWVAARDPRTPLRAKVVAGCVVAYALSPIDLIPDFIPILGYLDDIILVPLGIALAVALIPPLLMAEYRVIAQSLAERPTSRAGTYAVVLTWIILLGLGAWAATVFYRRP